MLSDRFAQFARESRTPFLDTLAVGLGAKGTKTDFGPIPTAPTPVSYESFQALSNLVGRLIGIAEHQTAEIAALRAAGESPPLCDHEAHIASLDETVEYLTRKVAKLELRFAHRQPELYFFDEYLN